MHWRGDRSTGQFGTSAFDSNLSFLNFAPAFQTLVGSSTAPSQAQMQTFANFQLAVVPPPNPIRNLDNSLTAPQAAGQAFYSGTRPADGIVSSLVNELAGQSSFTCAGCHVLNAANGSFGTGGNQSFEGLPQIVKIPQLRNAYAKIGMFGNAAVQFVNAADSGNTGNQIRGFGFTGDGSIDTLFHFLSASVFNPTSNSGFPQNNPDATRRDVEQYLLAFDSDLAPIVGQQVTLTSTNAAGANPRINLLEQRAGAAFVSKTLNGATTECDLVAQVVQGKAIEGFLYDPVAGNFIQNHTQVRISDAELRALAATPGEEVTYTAATPGSGSRVAFGGVVPQRVKPLPRK